MLGRWLLMFRNHKQHSCNEPKICCFLESKTTSNSYFHVLVSRTTEYCKFALKSDRPNLVLVYFTVWNSLWKLGWNSLWKLGWNVWCNCEHSKKLFRRLNQKCNQFFHVMVCDRSSKIYILPHLLYFCTLDAPMRDLVAFTTQTPMFFLCF